MSISHTASVPTTYALKKLPSRRKVPKELRKCCSTYLETIHRFCPVPDDVTFRIPRQEERVETPPPGFFTCYQAHLMRFRIWFPIPVIVVKVLNRFNVSLSQITPCSLQQLIGIFVWRFECGKNLDAAYLEGLLTMRRRLGNLSYVFKLRDHMMIIQGFTSHEKHWREFMFYICLDSACLLRKCAYLFLRPSGA